MRASGGSVSVAPLPGSVAGAEAADVEQGIGVRARQRRAHHHAADDGDDAGERARGRQSRCRRRDAGRRTTTGPVRGAPGAGSSRNTTAAAANPSVVRPRRRSVPSVDAQMNRARPGATAAIVARRQNASSVGGLRP